MNSADKQDTELVKFNDQIWENERIENERKKMKE